MQYKIPYHSWAEFEASLYKKPVSSLPQNVARHLERSDVELVHVLGCEDEFLPSSRHHSRISLEQIEAILYSSNWSSKCHMPSDPDWSISDYFFACKGSCVAQIKGLDGKCFYAHIKCKVKEECLSCDGLTETTMRITYAKSLKDLCRFVFTGKDFRQYFKMSTEERGSLWD
jgi:hypothetical protein